MSKADSQADNHAVSDILDAPSSSQTEIDAHIMAIVARALGVVVVLDSELVVTRAGFGVPILGFPVGSFVGTSGLEVVHPEDRDAVRQLIERARTNSGVQSLADVRLTHADGHWMPTELNVVSCFDDPKVNGFVVHIHDMTQQVALRTNLEVERETHEALIANLPAAVFRCQAMAPYTDLQMGGAIEQITGYPPIDFVNGTQILDSLALPEYLPRTDRELAEAIAEKRPYVMEYPIRHRDGSVRWVSEHARVTFDELDQPEFIEGVLFDITKSVDATAELIESKTWINVLVENVPDVVFRCDPYPPYSKIFISPSVERLTGYTEKELNDKGIELFDLILAEDRERVVETVTREIEKRESYIVDYQTQHRDGSLRWIEEHGKPTYEGETPAFIDGVLIDVTERKLLEQRLTFGASHDSLTGLANRSLFLERAEEAIEAAGRTSGQVSLLFVDLDRFKTVIEALGRDASDALLVVFTSRLYNLLRTTDIAGRIGSDEFVVLCAHSGDPSKTEADALGMAKRLVSELSKPFRVRGRDVFLTASIGVALGAPGESSNELLHDASSAASRAKNLGRDRVQLFDESLRDAAALALELEADLYRALDAEEIVLLFQPIVEIGSEKLVGIEALVRWEHPRRGLLTPDQFLETAEATGLIVGIGHTVIDLAVAAIAEVPESVLSYVAINLSPQELAHSAIVDWIAAALQRTGVSGSRLRIEITEGAELRDSATAIGTLNRLRDLGVLVAIDDFGTGFSSLSYLLRLPIDIVKIDQSFTANLISDSASTTIISGIVGLAQNLGYEVIAEGVEDVAQAEKLRDLGCTLGQGYLYSKPVALSELLPN